MRPHIDAKALPAPGQAVRRVTAARGEPPRIGCMLKELPLEALQTVHPAVEERIRSLDLLQRPLDIPSWLDGPADLSAFLLAVPLWAMASQVRGQTVYQIVFGAEYLPLLRRRLPPTHKVFVLVFPSTLSHGQVLRMHAVATAGVFERGRLSTVEVVSALLNHEAKGIRAPVASPSPSQALASPGDEHDCEPEAVGPAAGARSPDSHRLPARRAGAATTPSGGVSPASRARTAGSAPRPDAPTRAPARRPRVPAKAAAQPGGTDSQAAGPSDLVATLPGLPPKG